jgi:putative NIF3 family GTP cyclohydrolase 1 type 2
MAYKTNHDEHLEGIMNQLADSVLGLSDEAILAEIRDAGVEPTAVAERVRVVLRDALQTLERVNIRLSNLGHTVDSNGWQAGRGGYHNKCLNCGSAVSFTIANGEIRGRAVIAPCPDTSQREIARRQASRQ